MMIWGLGTDIIMGLLTAVLLSVLMSEVYAQIPPPPPPPLLLYTDKKINTDHYHEYI